MTHNKVPFVDGAQLEAIIARHPTPFHLYNETGIRQAARDLKAAFAWSPRFKEYFAVKATPTPAILRILGEEGCGLDCSSLTELMLAESCGFSGADIMFSSNVTPDQDFRLARRLNAIINLDDLSHLDVLQQLTGLPETLSFRFNPGADFDSTNAIMAKPADAKYGLTRTQLLTAFQTAAAAGVTRFGLHAFLASNTLSGDYYVQLARSLFTTVVDIQNQTGVKIDFVNLSGGIGIPYHPHQAAVDIRAVGDAIREAYQTILLPQGRADLAIYTELGRFITGPQGCLVATVIREKQIYKHYLGLDACAADLLRPAMYGAYHHLSVSGKSDQAWDQIYDVTGGLCENNDKFAIDRSLPHTSIGDRIIIHDTGAHGRAMGYNYNGKLRCGEVLLCSDGSTREIRRAETPADYFATLQGFM